MAIYSTLWSHLFFVPYFSCHLAVLPALADAISDDTQTKLFSLGCKSQEGGHPEKAKQYLQKAIELNPNSEIGRKAKMFLDAYVPHAYVSPQAEAENLRGYTFFVNDRLDAAATVFEHCCSSHPQFEWSFYNLACVYLQKRDSSKAKYYASKAVAINPNYVNGWLALSNACILQRDLKSARVYANKAFLIDSKNPQVKDIMTFLKRQGY